MLYASTVFDLACVHVCVCVCVCVISQAAGFISERLNTLKTDLTVGKCIGRSPSLC